MSFSNEHRNPRFVRRRLRRIRHALLALCLATLGVMILAGPAAAAPTTNTQVVSVKSGEADLGGFQLKVPVVLPDPIPIVLTNLTVSASAQWTGDLTTKLGWDTDKVRQGADVDVSRVATLASGKLHVKWLLSGEIDGIDFGPTTIETDNISCDPKLSGGGFDCSADSPGLALPGAIPSPAGFFVPKLGIGVEFDITPTGAIVTRGLTIGGNNVVGPNDLSLTGSTQSEKLSIPCTASAGDAAGYNLDPFHWKPNATATEQVEIRIVEAFDPFGLSEIFDVAKIPVGSAIVSNPSFDLAGNGFLTSMGALLPNNIKPTIAPFGAFSGQEGSAVSLSASVNSQCPIDSYVWSFSDGTKSYGPTPQRTFTDNGVYDGQLTVTDVTGLSTTKSFTIGVSNAKPSVNAGPDTTADWGRLVQFNGQATDPGSSDQGTLQYSWSFGDGTPSATGGPGVTHSYATPGDYIATLQVCDKDGGCDSDTRVVHVTTRDTTLGYTGSLLSSPSKTVALTANLVDEYGQAVIGKKVTFVLGTQTVVGTSDASGHVSVSLKLTQKSGSYALAVTFPAGDAKYGGASDSRTFVIGK